MKKNMKMQYPATKWQDALPCGNGKIGALICGNIKKELIIVNHDRLYLHKYKRPHFEDVHEHLPQARSLMMEGKCVEGYNYLMEKFEENFKNPGSINPYQPFCDIHIETDTIRAFSNYCRELDFETGQAKVTWSENDNKFQRKQFVSRKEDAIIIQISAMDVEFSNIKIGLSAHGVLNATGMGSGNDVESECGFTWESNVDGDYILFSAILDDDTKIGAVGKIISKEKISNISDYSQGISVVSLKDVKDVLVIIKLYIGEEKEVAFNKIKKELDAVNKSYDELFLEHKAIHSALFNSLRININDKGNDLVNEQLMLDAYNGNVPNELIQKMTDYGRYLLIASTKKGSMPPNLQGIWNGDYNPAWSSDYHNDVNIQMNYWAALPGNLPETMMPLFDYYDSMMDDFKENARKLYGCRGILLPICNTTHGLLYRPNIWNGWTGAAGWIAWHYYDYFLHTQNKNFLIERALPFMYETALFYLDFFVEDGKGNLLSIPSMSPENKPSNSKGLINSNATMDFAIAKQVLTNLLDAYELLGISNNKQEFELLLSKIPSYKINEDGAIKEWMKNETEDNYHHRHLSHIYPLFPGIEISQEKNKRIFDAIKVAVEKRLVVGLAAQSGWSFAHMANIYARLGQGDRALECIELLCRSCTGDNLFTYHNDWRSQGISMYWGHNSRPPFQIDANFGITAAVLEMLVFSDVNIIKLLPALPVKWINGSIENILCRGNRLLSIQWNTNGSEIITKCKVNDHKKFTLRTAKTIKNIEILLGEVEITDSEFGDNYKIITPKNCEFSLKIKLK